MNFKRPMATIFGVAALGLHPAVAAHATTYGDVAPILAARCAICHQGEGAPLGLKLDGPPYLDAAEIELIVAWIAQGAPNADGLVAPLPVGAEVRLHGELEASGRLDGLPLEILAGARRDDSAALRHRGWVLSPRLPWRTF